MATAMATDGTGSGALADVFERWARRERIPGIAWGLVRSGDLAASGGLGTLRLEEPATPDADSVFRIASMTKSFTGAALMTLVAGRRLRLDDPVSEHVPELAPWRGPTSDGPSVTVRHLVSMEAGLPTDDAWADRHLNLPPEAMDALIAAGAAFAWTPGTRFEYSNLGWGLVGRVIERVAGERVQEYVGRVLLEPLGMASTTWVRPPSGAIAEPYRLQDGAWVHEGDPVGDGTIAPMGGLWTTVRDLARWVAFFLDAWPPRDGPDEGPLPRWARREMQQLRRVDQVTRYRPSAGGPSRVSVTGYGVGLGVRIDERLGTSVGHSGGLPGYGSHMRWLPEHGVGVIGLANVTYGSMHGACIEALDVLADRDELGDPVGIEPSSALVEAASRGVALLSSWDDARADALFSDNVGADEAYERRADAARELVARSGELEVESIEAETPLRGTVSTAGADARVAIGLNHEARLQWLDVEDRLEPSETPIVVDGWKLLEAAGTAFVIVRPVGALAEAFTRWQGQTLDRIGVRCAVPSAHTTLKAFGSTGSPLSDEDERRIVEVVEAWASSCGGLELREAGLEVFREDGIPVVRLEAPSLLEEISNLRSASADAGLPGGASDRIAIDGWVPHLSLAYPVEDSSARWDELEVWMRGAGPVDAATCVALHAEVVTYTGGAERRLGVFPLSTVDRRA
jgi:CubicO group peptidase (beta-lactamase class C family)